jgi:hypothetical protein
MNVSQVTKVPWPDIEGIDAADTHARWCGDAPLFIRMLSRLFDEFDAIRFPPDIEVPEENARFVRHMHKLRGGAGALGAKKVHGLAGELEAACVSGDIAGAAQLSHRLSSELLLLNKSARPVIEAERIRADSLLLTGAIPGRNAGSYERGKLT